MAPAVDIAEAVSPALVIYSAPALSSLVLALVNAAGTLVLTFTFLFLGAVLLAIALVIGGALSRFYHAALALSLVGLFLQRLRSAPGPAFTPGVAAVSLAFAVLVLGALVILLLLLLTGFFTFTLALTLPGLSAPSLSTALFISFTRFVGILLQGTATTHLVVSLALRVTLAPAITRTVATALALVIIGALVGALLVLSLIYVT